MMMNEFVVLFKVLGMGQLVGHGNHNNCVLSEQIFQVGLRFHMLFFFAHDFCFHMLDSLSACSHKKTCLKYL